MRAFSLVVLLLAAACSSASALEKRSEPQPPAATPTEWNAAAEGADDAGTWQEAGAAAVSGSTAEVASTSMESSSKLPAGDCAIMNYALALEHLERTFYEESLGWLRAEDFHSANFPNAQQVYLNFVHISQHERQHVKTLQRVITTFCGTPVPPCKYNFGVSDVKSFLAVARLFEKIGVSAYDGALALIATGDIQTAAGTIASVESRHASFLNSASDSDPFPQDFDTPLAKSAVVSMAASVIESCPFDIPSTLGVPFKSLSLVGPSDIRVGRNIQLEYEGSSSGGHFCSFLFSDKSVTVPLDPGCGCKVPKGCRGDIFVAVISRNEQLTLKNTDSLIIAGPIVVNVDTSEEDSCKGFVHGSPRSHSGWSSYEKPYSSWHSSGYSSSSYDSSVQHITAQESSEKGQWSDSEVASIQGDTAETVDPADESAFSSEQDPSSAATEVTSGEPEPASQVEEPAAAGDGASDPAAAVYAAEDPAAAEDAAEDPVAADPAAAVDAAEDPAAADPAAATDPAADPAANRSSSVPDSTTDAPAEDPATATASDEGLASVSSSADPSAATESPSAAEDVPSETPLLTDGGDSTGGADAPAEDAT